METTDLIIDVINGIEEEDATEGNHTCDQGEYQVLIYWNNDNAFVVDVKRNGWPWSLPSHINRNLLIEVVKEKVKEIRLKHVEKEEAFRKEKEEREELKSVNWFGSMADH